MSLTHYIIVRRDLTIGQVCAQIVHAAGESVALLYAGSSEKERPSQGKVGGLSPSPRATFSEGDPIEGVSLVGETPTSPASLPKDMIAVVLSVRNEIKLWGIHRKLERESVPHVVIEEPDLDGAATAIGIMPVQRERVGRALKDCVIFVG